MLNQSPKPELVPFPFLLPFFVTFLPRPFVVTWVFRLTFSPSSSPPSPSHFQLFVSVRYRKRCGRGCGSLAVYAILFTLLPCCKFNEYNRVSEARQAIQWNCLPCSHTPLYSLQPSDLCQYSYPEGPKGPPGGRRPPALHRS